MLLAKIVFYGKTLQNLVDIFNYSFKEVKSLFFIVACTFDITAKPLLNLRSQRYMLMLFSKSSIILALTFMSLKPS